MRPPVYLHMAINWHFFFQDEKPVKKSASNSEGWNDDNDWGNEWGNESKQAKKSTKPKKTEKQDSWGEFEDWLSEEKTGGGKKD